MPTAAVIQCTTGYGSWFSIMRHICLPWIYYEGLPWCKPHWLSCHWWKQQPLWNLETESKHCNRHYCTEINARLNSAKENLLEDPRHIWSEKASGTETVALAEWQGKQHLLLCPRGSIMAAEPYHPHLKLLLTPWGGSHFNSCRCGQWTRTHNCQRWSGCSYSTLRHNEKLTTMQKSHIKLKRLTTNWSVCVTFEI